MTGLRQISARAKVFLAGIAGVLAIGTILLLPSPAHAFWIGGGPWGGWYGPGPWGYPAPAPYYYYPPPTAYYPPPPPTGYGAPPAAPAPSAYTPQPGYTPPAGAASPAPAATITYTSKPAFRNAAGQTCREYTTSAGGRQIYGTACRQADGQWRVVN
jgi:hypothetical protein